MRQFHVSEEIQKKENKAIMNSVNEEEQDKSTSSNLTSDTELGEGKKG